MLVDCQGRRHCKLVSVPLRGIGSEKLLAVKNGISIPQNKVSVPLRGIGSEKQRV